MDYGMMSPLIAGNNQDQQGPPLMDDERYFNPVVHGKEPMEAAAHGMGGGSSGPPPNTSGLSPSASAKSQPPPQVSQQQPS
jgi:hypothetical protein